jgi:hypothetical protein
MSDCTSGVTTVRARRFGITLILASPGRSEEWRSRPPNLPRWGSGEWGQACTIMVRDHLNPGPPPNLPRWAMHYPYLEYCITRVPERVGGVMTGVLPSRALGARASGAHGAGTNPSRASHTRARHLECGSHAAAPAVLAIRRVGHRSPSWSRGC